MSRGLRLPPAPGHDEGLVDGMVGLSRALGGARRLLEDLLSDAAAGDGPVDDEELLHGVLGLASLERQLSSLLESAEEDVDAEAPGEAAAPVRGILR
jgi:hypothetical protein